MSFLSRENLEKFRDQARWRFAAVLATLFLVIAGIGASHHEFWRDEAQAWLIARDEPTLPALLEQAHYEGAPPLWNLMLRPLALLEPGWPEAMQVLTWALAGLTVFIFVRFAPFSRVHKILILANYYLLFEYGIVCRNYLLGILCLSIACVLYPVAKQRPWGFTFAVIGGCFASVHSMIVAVAMGAGFWLSLGWQTWRQRGQLDEANLIKRQLLAFAGFVAGVGLAVYSIRPRADGLYAAASGWNLWWESARFGKIACALVTACFPTPRPQGYFWIPAWDTPELSYNPTLMAILALGIAGGTAVLLRRHLGALLFYLIGTLGVAAFLYLKYIGFSRHTGFLFFTLLFAFWIKRSDEARKGVVRSRSYLIAGIGLAAMMAVQAVMGVWAVHEDFGRDFSTGKKTAQYLRDRHLENAFMVVGPDWAGAPLAAYLNRSFYYPHERRYGSFTRWDNKRENEMRDGDFIEVALAEAKGRDMVIALDHPLPEALMQKHGIVFVKFFGGSLTPAEDYYLHFAAGKKPAASGK